MATFRHESVLPHPVEVVRAWHERPGALERLSPAWQQVQVVAREGSRITLTLRAGPTRRRWIARHQPESDGFSDIMEKGPFARWSHRHRFLAAPEGGTLCIDEVDYALGFPASLAPGYVRDSLARSFTSRHRQLAFDLARQRAAPQRALTIVVTGASGLIGSRLVPFLTTAGHTVRRLKLRGAVDPTDLKGADAVVHLAGEAIDQRWTSGTKEHIRQSREQTTRSLAEVLASMQDGPRVFVCASAMGIYGDRADEPLTETASPGKGFLAEVVQAWEAACEPARAAGIRVANTRFGLVLAVEGGALRPLLPPFRAGVGGPVGSAKQWWSWVHIDDVVGALYRAVYDPSLEGPVNVVAPTSVRNREFVRTLGKTLHRPAITPLPTFAVKAIFGEMGSLLLESQRVVPEKLQKIGFDFTHPELGEALAFELGVK